MLHGAARSRFLPYVLAGTMVAAEACHKGPTPPNIQRAMVSIDFDDGYASAFQFGVPVFESAGLRTTHYIITQRVGSSGFMSWSEVRALQDAGNDIGAHTRTHPQLPTLASSQIRDEVAGSLADLRAHGIAPATFAYPYGDYNDSVVAIVGEAGYAAARTTLGGFNTPTTACLLLHAMIVDSLHHTTIGDVQGWVDAAAKSGSWLILLIHRVDENENAISVRHELLQDIAEYLLKTHAQVVTMRDGLRLEGCH